jgi:uncharacterized protein (DUF1697 family)
METIKYLILLRGINVGGNNIIKMSDLKNIFEAMKFTKIKTYIQSGNIIFNASERNKTQLMKIIEKTLSERFKYNSQVIIYTYNEYEKIIQNIPDDFGKETDKYRYDVWFLKEPLTAEEVAKQIKIREGLDKICKGENVIYTYRSQKEENGKIYFIKMPQTIYQNITVRNLSTTKKIYELMKCP